MADVHDDTGGEKTVWMRRPPTTVFQHMRVTLPSKAYLVIIGGMDGDRGSVFPVDQPKVTLGRASECTIVLQDQSISRVHAEIVQRKNEGTLIRDLDSTNGTYLAGQRIKEAVLNHGDKVLLGRRTILKYESYDQLDAAYQTQLYESSTRDGLTGIYNRRCFNQMIVSELSFTKRHHMWLSLLIFDLDHFKKINDVYGHRNGDRLLTRVANAVYTILKTEDFFARYGGEEFAIIASGTNYERGMDLGQRVRQRVENEAIIADDYHDKTIKTTASIGVVTVAHDAAAEAAALISAAEKNLSEAKSSGRNKVVCTLMH